MRRHIKTFGNVAGGSGGDPFLGPIWALPNKPKRMFQGAFVVLATGFFNRINAFSKGTAPFQNGHQGVVAFFVFLKNHSTASSILCRSKEAFGN
jgi:hypothetical protein